MHAERISNELFHCNKQVLAGAEAGEESPWDINHKAQIQDIGINPYDESVYDQAAKLLHRNQGRIPKPKAKFVAFLVNIQI